MEELWFRGIFLGKLRPVLGVTLDARGDCAGLCVAALHGDLHHGVQRVVFAAIVFGLGILNGYVMLKSDSIWGSVLIHAGYDLLVIIPLLVQLG